MKTLISIITIFMILAGCEKKRMVRIKKPVVTENENQTATEANTSDTDASESEEVSESTSPDEDNTAQNSETTTSNPLHQGELTIKANPKEGERLYREAVTAVKDGDVEKARSLYLKSCEAGFYRGCHRYGYHEEKAKRFESALKFYAVACHNKVFKACNNLGWHHEKRGNIAGAQDWYSWACLRSHPGSCANLRRVEDKAKIAH